MPAFDFSDGVSDWHKQDQIHQSGPANRHGTNALLPWHRDYINRYEVLLQEANPLVKLLYWDWTTDPENSSGFNFFTSSFMGASGRGGPNRCPKGSAGGRDVEGPGLRVECTAGEVVTDWRGVFCRAQLPAASGFRAEQVRLSPRRSSSRTYSTVTQRMRA